MQFSFGENINHKKVQSTYPLDFANMSGCTELIKEPTHKLGNCLDLLFNDAPGVVDPLVGLPLGNSDHFSTSVSVNMGFKLPNITLDVSEVMC